MTSRVSLWPIILILAFLLGEEAVKKARGAELQFEFGQCRFGLADNGTFREEGFDYRNYMTPKCGSIGVADKFGESSVGWRIAYLDTGNIQARGNVARYGDDQNRQPCDSKTTIGCRARFNGSGYTYGVMFGLTKEYPLWIFNAQGEAGIFYFRHRFHANAVQVDSGAGPEQQYDSTSKWSAAPSPYFGLSLRYSHIYAGARYFWPTGHRELSLTNHSLTQIYTGAAF